MAAQRRRLERLDLVLADDHTYRLYYTLDDLYEMQQAEYDAKAAGVPAQLVGMKLISFNIWLGLRHDQPDLTLEQVKELLDAWNTDYYAAVIQQAMNPIKTAAPQQALNGQALPSTGEIFGPSHGFDLESAKANSGS